MSKYILNNKKNHMTIFRDFIFFFTEKTHETIVPCPLSSTDAAGGFYGSMP